MKHGMASVSILFVACLWVGVAHAADDAIYETTVYGEILIGTEGEVREVKLDEGLSQEVHDIIENHIRTWRFQPVIENGEAIELKTYMTMDLFAESAADGYRLRIGQTFFRESIRANPQNELPHYPLDPLAQEIEGVVRVHMLVNEAGRVTRTHVYQSGLSAERLPRMSAGAQRSMRRQFERAVRQAARRWRFDPARLGPDREVRMTVVFEIDEAGPRRWPTYRYGDATLAPWVQKDRVVQDPADDANPGVALALSGRIQLIEEVEGRVL